MADSIMGTHKLATRCHCHCHNWSWEELGVSIRSLSEVWRYNFGDFAVESIDGESGYSQSPQKLISGRFNDDDGDSECRNDIRGSQGGLGIVEKGRQYGVPSGLCHP